MGGRDAAAGPALATAAAAHLAGHLDVAETRAVLGGLKKVLAAEGTPA